MKLLIIDDDSAMTDLIRLFLKSTFSDIFVSNSGEEGLQLAKKEDPDVVILDLMLPDLDGWQVCQKIREFSKVPILILSALDTPGMVAEALNAGADDYLIKPVTSNMLIAHINKVLRRNPMNGK